LTPSIHLKTDTLAARALTNKHLRAELPSQWSGIQKRASINNTTRRWTLSEVRLNFFVVDLP
jgi:hypothetical protein